MSIPTEIASSGVSVISSPLLGADKLSIAKYSSVLGTSSHALVSSFGLVSFGNVAHGPGMLFKNSPFIIGPFSVTGTVCVFVKPGASCPLVSTVCPVVFCASPISSVISTSVSSLSVAPPTTGTGLNKLNTLSSFGCSGSPSASLLFQPLPAQPVSGINLCVYAFAGNSVNLIYLTLTTVPS